MTAETYLTVRYGIATDGLYWADVDGDPAWARSREDLMALVDEMVAAKCRGREWYPSAEPDPRGALGT